MIRCTTARRVARDHAGARRLLRAVVEVELDVRVRGQVEADRLQRLEADLGRALLRVRRLERREPAHVGHVVARRHVGVPRAEQALEPAVAQRHDTRLPSRRSRPRAPPRARGARCPSPPRSARPAPAIPESSASSSSPALSSSSRSALNSRSPRPGSSPSSSRSAYSGSTASCACAVRSGISSPAERHPRGEHPVLELVVALDELVRDQAALAGLAQPVEPLALVARRAGLGLAQRLELPAAEEIGVARDDLRLLGGLLLPDPHRARLLGALEHVLAEAVLELGGAANDCGGHATYASPRRATCCRASSTSSAGSNGFGINGARAALVRRPRRPSRSRARRGSRRRAARRAARPMRPSRGEGRAGRDPAAPRRPPPSPRRPSPPRLTRKPSSSRFTRQTMRKAASSSTTSTEAAGHPCARRSYSIDRRASMAPWRPKLSWGSATLPRSGSSGQGFRRRLPASRRSLAPPSCSSTTRRSRRSGACSTGSTPPASPSSGSRRRLLPRRHTPSSPPHWRARATRPARSSRRST